MDFQIFINSKTEALNSFLQNIMRKLKLLQFEKIYHNNSWINLGRNILLKHAMEGVKF